MTFTPSDAQAAAVRAIVEWYCDPAGKQMFYLAGYAGTGKSTVYEVVREALYEHGAKNIVTCAYTGKAANVLRRKGNPDAMTIHAAVYSVLEDPTTGKVRFVKNEMGAAADADLIGLDECSMVNDEIAEDLLSFGKRILVMGDPGQLPPINGPGAFTAGTPDVFLTEVHRQAAESPILRLATAARLGERIEVGDYGQGVRVLRLTKDTAEEAYRDDTQTLCGVHTARMKITAEIRKRRGFEGEWPLAGETLICMKNDRELGIFNGGLGECLKARRALSGQLKLSVQMEDRFRPLDDHAASEFHFRKHFDPAVEKIRERGVLEFDWGYALTTHKAQGSSWPVVTVVDDSAAFREDRSKWLYTAITRAERGLTLLRRM
jgi:exodeoxyribonuclease-5